MLNKYKFVKVKSHSSFTDIKLTLILCNEYTYILVGCLWDNELAFYLIDNNHWYRYHKNKVEELDNVNKFIQNKQRDVYEVIYMKVDYDCSYLYDVIKGDVIDAFTQLQKDMMLMSLKYLIECKHFVLLRKCQNLYKGIIKDNAKQISSYIKKEYNKDEDLIAFVLDTLIYELEEKSHTKKNLVKKILKNK